MPTLRRRWVRSFQIPLIYGAAKLDRRCINVLKRRLGGCRSVAAQIALRAAALAEDLVFHRNAVEKNGLVGTLEMARVIQGG